MEGRTTLLLHAIEVHSPSLVKIKHNSAVVFHTILDLSARFSDVVVAPAFVALWRVALAFCTFAFPPDWSAWSMGLSSQ